MGFVISPVLVGVPVIDANGDPLSGGKIYTYLSGTSTPATTWADSGGVTANPNPIILDANGYSPSMIWLDSADAYRMVIKTPGDVQVGPILDNLIGVIPGSVQSFPATSNLSMGGFRLTNLDNASVGGDAMSRDAGDARWLRTPATANHSMGGFRITSLADATSPTDAMNRQAGDARWLASNGNGSLLSGLTMPQLTWAVPASITANATIDYTYNGAIVVVDSASALTMTLADANAAGFSCKILRKGTGTVAIARQTTGLINGSSSSKSITSQWNIAHIYNYAAGAASVTLSA